MDNVSSWLWFGLLAAFVLQGFVHQGIHKMHIRLHEEQNEALRQAHTERRAAWAALTHPAVWAVAKNTDEGEVVRRMMEGRVP